MTAAAGWDVLALRGLRVAGRHGALESERSTAQDFVVDAALLLDTGPAAASDDLADTVDYGALAERLATVIAGPPVELIETLAQRLADTCLADPRVREVELCVHKPRAPIGHPFDDVSVTIRRVRA